MARDVVILTVFDRPHAVLMNTLGQLVKADTENTEVVIVDDGSSRDYSQVRAVMDEAGLKVTWLTANTVKDRPETYHLNGHNNPAYVNNLALDAAAGCERVFFLSSDTMIPPRVLDIAREVVDGGAVFVPTVVDLDSSAIFCSPAHVWPMNWFTGARYEDVVTCGKFDEEFLKGMAFEDNDFMGRLCLEVGKLTIHKKAVVIHQSHKQTAYSDNWEGFKRSEAYCKEKWDGFVPWRHNGLPFYWRAESSLDDRVEFAVCAEDGV